MNAEKEATAESVKDEAAPAKELQPYKKQGDVANYRISDDEFFGDELDTGMEGMDAADVALPRLAVMQGLSPQINKRKDEYIEGAQLGNLVNLGTGKLMPDPYPIVIAKYERRYVEWSPRQDDQVCPLDGFPKVFGKGLIRDWGTDANALNEVTRDDNTGKLWTPEGNELLPTATYYCIDPETMTTFFIPMARTQFTASKKIMAKLNDEKISKGGTLRTAPTFWRIWNLTSSMKSRETNEWFVFDVAPGQLLKDHPNGRLILGVVKDFQETLRQNLIRLEHGEDEAAAPYADADTAEM